MLSGMQDEMTGQPIGPGDIDVSVGESMFRTFGQPTGMQPNADAMADAMERLQMQRKVEIKEVVVRTYNLSDDTQRNQYQYDLECIFLGIQLRTHAFLHRAPLQFVTDDKGSRYIAHLQWIEFRLLEEPTPTVGSG